VAAEGTSDAFSHPHKRRNVAFRTSASIKSSVSGRLPVGGQRLIWNVIAFFLGRIETG